MTFKIAGREIGPEFPPYIICEISANHNGSLERMLELVNAAAATGCDAIKIQSYTPDTLTIECSEDDFLIKGGLWDKRTLYDLYQEAYTPFEWHEQIFTRAAELGVTLFSTPFDRTAVDLLEDLDAPAYKIASFEIVDLPLIKYVASKKKPMIISTGLANLTEIEEAVKTAKDAGCQDIILLHCISSYPAPAEDSNLRTISNLGETFGVVSGLSDHTHGTAVSVASIALGGSVIEKHFTLDRSLGGPDSAFSLEPDEFTRLCRECKDAWKALGRVNYDVKDAEKGNIVFRRSIYIVKDIDVGELLTEENTRVIRPGYGLAPRNFEAVLGARARTDIKRGTALKWSMIDGV